MKNKKEFIFIACLGGSTKRLLTVSIASILSKNASFPLTVFCLTSLQLWLTNDLNNYGKVHEK